MKFNTKLLEGEWQKYNDEVEFLIRPFPNSKSPFRMDGTLSIGEYNLCVFNACVLDWRGVEDTDGKPLKCNNDNKTKVFDLDNKIYEFVIEKQASIKAQQEVEVKN
jgi:hypothetical protein